MNKVTIDEFLSTSYAKPLQENSFPDGVDVIGLRMERPQEGVNCSNIFTVELLLHMAVKGVVPNGFFSDYEVGTWELMRRVLRDNGIEVKSV